MFFSKEVALILDRSTVTLKKILEMEPSLEPGRQGGHRGYLASRQFTVEDIHSIFDYMGSDNNYLTKPNYNSETLDKRIVAFGIAILITKPNRRDLIMQEIGPVLEKYDDLKELKLMYKQMGFFIPNTPNKYLIY